MKCSNCMLRSCQGAGVTARTTAHGEWIFGACADDVIPVSAKSELLLALSAGTASTLTYRRLWYIFNAQHPQHSHVIPPLSHTFIEDTTFTQKHHVRRHRRCRCPRASGCARRRVPRTDPRTPGLPPRSRRCTATRCQRPGASARLCPLRHHLGSRLRLQRRHVRRRFGRGRRDQLRRERRRCRHLERRVHLHPLDRLGR